MVSFGGKFDGILLTVFQFRKKSFKSLWVNRKSAEKNPELVFKILYFLSHLPWSSGGEVLDDNPVVCLGAWRPSAPSPGWRPSPSEAAATSAAVTVAVPVAWGPGQLHPHPSPVHVLAVHVVNRVVGIPEETDANWTWGTNLKLSPNATATKFTTFFSKPLK